MGMAVVFPPFACFRPPDVSRETLVANTLLILTNLEVIHRLARSFRLLYKYRGLLDKISIFLGFSIC
jgi:hypothetical protein